MRTTPLPPDELAKITQRGRMLVEYDQAASHAIEALLTTQPQRNKLQHYIASKTELGWSVAFGRLSHEQQKFLIFYEASRAANSQQFSVSAHGIAKEDGGFYFVGARAIETAAAEFQLNQRGRPYNVLVLPYSSNQIYVYLVPAQTQAGIYPLGGDVRYAIAADGNQILERRELHRSILDIPVKNSNPRVHTHGITDVPEDTDVFHVLTRRPSCREIVVTRHHVYTIEIDGTIRYTGETDNLVFDGHDSRVK